ncbi:sce7726 family protein [Terriglobus albidus]|uniref:Sce7726 family protein n=1 Tax=Terriglobus albidus TaxID=1592106 RepID=A0A5B9E6E6_9BACT|nr:sce7726 family protein [Terriglobus albidus]
MRELRQEYSDENHDLILEEFGCNSSRADVAVINGALHAFEIKSDSDTLERLYAQVEAYKGVFQYVTLVCGERLLESARKVIPRWWGLQRAQHNNGKVVLITIRKSKKNPTQDASALARMLWKTEALTVLRKYGHSIVTSRSPAEDVVQAVAKCIPVHLLSDEVRYAIKARGGSGFAKRSSLDDDLYTTESIARQNHLLDLSWLLSPQYQHPPD